MKDKFDFRSCTVSKLEDGILLVEIKKIKEMIVQDVIGLHTCVKELSDGKKVCLLTTFQEYIPMNDDVMAESMKKEYQDRILASALVITSPALRIAVKFFTTFHKPKQPRKIFDTKESAQKWLKKIKQEQKGFALA